MHVPTTGDRICLVHVIPPGQHIIVTPGETLLPVRWLH